MRNTWKDRILKLRNEPTVSEEIERLISIREFNEGISQNAILRIKQRAIKAHDYWKEHELFQNDLYEMEYNDKCIEYFRYYQENKEVSCEIFIGIITLFQRYLCNVGLYSCLCVLLFL